MIELTAKLSSKNQITLPAAVRRRLGVGASDTIAFVLNEEGAVEIRRARDDLESILGSVPPLPGASADLEQEIAEATAEEIDEDFAAIPGIDRWRLDVSGESLERPLP